VLRCDPLQASAKIALHFGHQVIGELLQIQPVAEFRRDDRLEQALVASGLPLSAVNRDAVTGRTETLTTALMRRTLAADVAAVCSPLAGSVMRCSPSDSFRCVLIPDKNL
jgi:hypothetical protein